MNIHFDQEESIQVVAGKNLLKLALENDIPMAHACGGNARCSTCRVLLLEGELPPRNELEQKLADKLGWGENIRLSCQMEISNAVTLRRVVKDEVDRKILHQSNSATEKDLAILFSDIRSFTTFSERHFPHDIVHILNRYFLEMGAAIHNHQGTIDKYMGDGVMAIFGLQDGEHPAKQAYRAALEMLTRLEEFNKYLEETYQETFQIGIGIHFGPVVVGNVGHPDQISFTAIGDTVNVAARVESATKNLCDILVSESVYQHLDQDGWESTDLLLKGKTEVLRLFIQPSE